MPLTQLKITKFFKPAKLPEHIRQLRKDRKAKANKEDQSSKPKATPAVHKRTLAPSKTPETKSKPQAKTQKRHSAPPASKPAKPDTTKSPEPEQFHTTPKNQAILDHLAKSSTPKFYFPKDQRPTFRVLFPGTSVPKTSMLHGSPIIDKDLFNTLLASRIAAAHTVLRSAKLDRPRLPKSFVSSQIHLIQQSLRKPKKEKKSSPALKPETGSKPIKKPTPFALEFVPAATSTSEKMSSLSPEQLTTAKLRSSDIQTPETADMHALISSIRSRRSIIAKAQLTNTLIPYHEQHLSPDVQQVVKDCMLSLELTSFSFSEYVNQSSFIIDFTLDNVTVTSNGSPQTLGYVQKPLESKLLQLIALATQI
jgi:hypothetical protein